MISQRVNHFGKRTVWSLIYIFLIYAYYHLTFNSVANFGDHPLVCSMVALYNKKQQKRKDEKKTFTVLKVPITHEILCILAGKAHSHLRLDWSHGTMLYNLGDRIQFPNLRCCLPAAGEERMNQVAHGAERPKMCSEI